MKMEKWRQCVNRSRGKEKTFSLIMVLAVALILCSKSSYSEIYKWMDDKGEVHFTNDASTIPPEHLNKVSGVKEKKPPKLSQPKEKEDVVEKSPSPSTKKKEAIIKEGVSPDDPNAVIIEGGIKEEATEKKEKVTYSGSVKNNSNSALNSVEIIFTIKGRDGREEALSLPIKGKKGEGILESGEVGSFSIQPEMPFPLIAGYGYNFKWRFTTAQPK